MRLTLIATGFGNMTRRSEKESPSTDWLKKIKSGDDRRNIDVMPLDDDDDLDLPIFLKDRRRIRD